jgi:hypothetical protein
MVPLSNVKRWKSQIDTGIEAQYGAKRLVGSGTQASFVGRHRMLANDVSLKMSIRRVLLIFNANAKATPASSVKPSSICSTRHSK